MKNIYQILEKLYSLQNIGIKLGLDRVYKLLELTGNPHQKLNFIHVAGTNGKGSVCSIIAKSLQAAGFKVGFFSSPHLISLRERFRIDGRGISREELATIFDDIWLSVTAMKEQGMHITFFEACVAIAAKYFAENDCDFVLWETGLGGRLDGTNIVNPIVTAITGIGLDHEGILGDSEEKIAKEKAGIIKPGIPVFTGEMSELVFNAIFQAAKNKDAKVYSARNVSLKIDRFWKKGSPLPGWIFSDETSKNNYYFPFAANIQNQNLKLAFAIIKYLSERYKFNLDTALTGIASLKWPGRIQVLPDGKILDGAHNPQGIEVFVNTMKTCFPDTKFQVIFGCMAERNPVQSIRLLKEITSQFIFTKIDSTRSCLSPEEIFSSVKNEIDNIPVLIADNSQQAIARAGESKTVIAGSLYLAGEILKQYYSTEEVINI